MNNRRSKNNSKKPIYKKWWFWLLIIFVIGGIGNLMDNEQEADSSKKEDNIIQKKEKKSEKAEKKKKNQKKTNNKSKEEDGLTEKQIEDLNAKISEHLELDVGFAIGSLDRDGNPTENGTPNPDFEWALLVDSITFEKDSSIIANVKYDFDSLSEEEKNLVASRVQGSSISTLASVKEMNNEDLMRGLFVDFRLNGTSIGRSTVLDLKKYKWN